MVYTLHYVKPEVSRTMQGICGIHSFSVKKINDSASSCYFQTLLLADFQLTMSEADFDKATPLWNQFIIEVMLYQVPPGDTIVRAQLICGICKTR